jgi:integrase
MASNIGGNDVSVRKRTWKTAKGETKEAWVVAYTDQHKNPHIKTFRLKKQADAFHAKVVVDVTTGTHTPDSHSITIAEAGVHWIKTGKVRDLERTTLDQYSTLLNAHIVPYLGSVKLSKLTAPMVSDFRIKLREGDPPRSPYMVKRILTALSSILADAQESGLVAQNVVRSLTSRKKKRSKAEQRRKLRAGVDIPAPDEVKAILGVLAGRWRPLLMTALFTGLRASELRGLRWEDIDLVRAALHVRQRADSYNTMGAPKSEAGERTVPLPPMVVNVLREWKLACPKGPLDLVFPNGAGSVQSHANIVKCGWIPAQIAAGVCTIVKDTDGKVVLDAEGQPAREAKYTGLHAMRHFFASWCINRKADGGLELPGKVVQERLGHSSITMTMDTYGHLFPRGDDRAELAEAERAFF